MPRKFDELYGMTDDAKKKERKALVERKIKRNFQAALDNVDGQEIDAAECKAAAFESIENLDINGLLDAEEVLQATGKTKEAVKAIYKELFDEVLAPAGVK